jgi:hypothetical protein
VGAPVAPRRSPRRQVRPRPSATACASQNSRQGVRPKSAPSRRGISRCKSLKALWMRPRRRRDRVGQSFHRWYEAATGRYTRTDPLGSDGDPHPYFYAGANPLAFVDPWGLRYINRSCQPILYKPEGDGPAELLPSGGDKDKADGFYENCGQFCNADPGGQVFKTRNGVDIIFEGGCGVGKCVTWRYAGWSDKVTNEVPLPGRESGGWKDDSFLGRHPDWPDPPECCPIVTPPAEPPPEP